MVADRPITDIRDWLLYGRQFDHMKFGCVPIGVDQENFFEQPVLGLM